MPRPILEAGGGGTGGQEGEGLGSKELSPRRSDPPRRRSQAALAKHVGDRRGGDRDTEIEQLAFDPHVAPPGVLPSQAKDQFAKRRIDRGTPRPPASSSVLPSLELASPAPERLGHDREGRPPLPGKEPARSGEEGQVCGPVAGPVPPPVKDPQLVPEDGDLQLPFIDARPDQHTKQPAREAIQQEREHGAV